MSELKPYAKYSAIEGEFKFQVHIVNPTPNKYIRIVMETGAYTLVDDELVTTNTITKEFAELPPNGSLLVDESDLGERDFTIWYRFELYLDDGEKDLNLECKLMPHNNDISNY